MFTNLAIVNGGPTLKMGRKNHATQNWLLKQQDLIASNAKVWACAMHKTQQEDNAVSGQPKQVLLPRLPWILIAS